MEMRGVRPHELAQKDVNPEVEIKIDGLIDWMNNCFYLDTINPPEHIQKDCEGIPYAYYRHYCSFIKIGDSGFVFIVLTSDFTEDLCDDPDRRRFSISFDFWHTYNDIGDWYYKDYLYFTSVFKSVPFELDPENLLHENNEEVYIDSLREKHIFLNIYNNFEYETEYPVKEL